VRNAIICVIGGLLLLAGCGNQANKGAGIPVGPKWKGAPYRLAFDTKAAKPSPTGIDIPAVKFTANPDSLETRALLVMKFSAPAAANQAPSEHLMIGSAVDIQGQRERFPTITWSARARGWRTEHTGRCFTKQTGDMVYTMAENSWLSQLWLDA